MAKEIVKLSEINKEYSRILAERLAEGYVLNARTNSGTQGEYGRMDLTKDGGKTVRRLYLDRTTDYGYDDKDERYSYDTIFIIEEEFDNQRNSDILWNGKGNKVLEKKYYKIDRKRSAYELDPYTSYTQSVELMKAADKKHYNRADIRYIRSYRNIKPTQKIVEIVNHFKGFKNIKLSDIEKIEVGKYCNNPSYRFYFKNRKHTLTIDKDSRRLPHN